MAEVLSALKSQPQVHVTVRLSESVQHIQTESSEGHSNCGPPPPPLPHVPKQQPAFSDSANTTEPSSTYNPIDTQMLRLARVPLLRGWRAFGVALPIELNNFSNIIKHLWLSRSVLPPLI